MIEKKMTGRNTGPIDLMFVNPYGTLAPFALRCSIEEVKAATEAILKVRKENG